MPLENNGTLQKWHMTKKYTNMNKQIRHPQKMVPYKNGTPCEKMPKFAIRMN